MKQNGDRSVIEQEVYSQEIEEMMMTDFQITTGVKPPEYIINGYYRPSKWDDVFSAIIAIEVNEWVKVSGLCKKDVSALQSAAGASNSKVGANPYYQIMTKGGFSCKSRKQIEEVGGDKFTLWIQKVARSNEFKKAEVTIEADRLPINYR